jgi:hypothetical protein
MNGGISEVATGAIVTYPCDFRWSSTVFLRTGVNSITVTAQNSSGDILGQDFISVTLQ